MVSPVFNFLLAISVVISTCIAASATFNDQGNDQDPLLIIISFDGFRHDYLEKTDTPNFDRLVAMGVKTAGLIPAFATKTFPGHHTIATGLYQESHGILGNHMYDPVFESEFTFRTTESRWWNYGGEPIWVTNQRNGGRTASVLWPGDRFNISGMTATYHLPRYDESFSFNDRIDLVVGLMSNESANLGLLYFHEPDNTGHNEGPDSAATADIISLCDDTIGYLLDKLTEGDLLDDVNIIVTSDHGMSSVSPNQTVFLDEYVDPSRYLYTQNDPIFGLWPYEESDITDLYNDLKDAHPNMDVYLKADIPDEYHYQDNRRTSPILVVMQEGWHVWTNRSDSGYWETSKGNHGFVNALDNMRSFFIASGPAFKSNYASDDWLEAVDVYNLMCHVMSLDPAPNNGTFGHVEPLLSNKGTSSDRKSLVVFLLSFACVILLTFY